jgi:hypothetical protein
VRRGAKHRPDRSIGITHTPSLSENEPGALSLALACIEWARSCAAFFFSLFLFFYFF